MMSASGGSAVRTRTVHEGNGEISTTAQVRQRPLQPDPVARPLQEAGALQNLQRTHGNRFVQRLLAQRTQANAESVPAPGVEQAIQRSLGRGQPLESGVRTRMESAFGADFSGVQVHTNAEADTLNRALSARAFTTGKDIFFGQGEYNPQSSAGRETLAHELTHVLQQGGSTIQAELSVSQPDDPCEQEADRVARAVMQQEEQSRPDTASHAPIPGELVPPPVAGKIPRLQRLTVPLAGWGEVPRSMDDSNMEINLSVSLSVGGQRTMERTFSSSQRESISIPLNTNASLQIAGSVTVERDDPILNNTNSWDVDYTWRVAVDERGAIRLYAPTHGLTGGAGDAPWSLSVTPVQGETSVGLALTLGSTESTSVGNEIPVEFGGSFEPFGIGVDVSAGYSRSWGTSTGSTLTAGRGFVVDIETPAPPPEITFGPITVIRHHAYYFNTGQATPGTNPSTREEESIRLTTFLMNLDPYGEGGSDLSGFVDGYASPLGNFERNRELARARAHYILSRIRDLLPRANFLPRVYGEEIWREEGVPDVDNSERHRVVILEIRQSSPAE
ncbi:DUF4157 domain-containing protein [Candidatus Accumulibacter phosphatis]|jgi:hypothetical protein|uniref:DUF4157 domain-containing protein n=1 Tax=Candidatus Accumulibacter contiguus TaxID=2954381 RepID=A0ABX1T4Q1_9PROT|nr:DUF4157 domain-containing protein [Candidatus Accumulibacter contiguus]